METPIFVGGQKCGWHLIRWSHACGVCANPTEIIVSEIIVTHQLSLEEDRYFQKDRL